jgi:hypothetical protein
VTTSCIFFWIFWIQLSSYNSIIALGFKFYITFHEFDRFGTALRFKFISIFYEFSKLQHSCLCPGYGQTSLSATTRAWASLASYTSWFYFFILLVLLSPYDFGVALGFGFYFIIHELIRSKTSYHYPQVQFNLNFLWILKASALTSLPGCSQPPYWQWQGPSQALQTKTSCFFFSNFSDLIEFSWL